MSADMSEDAPDLLPEQHMPVLQRIFHSVVGEPRNKFTSTPPGLAQQLWDLFLLSADKCEQDHRTASAAWSDTVHPLSCLTAYDLLGVPYGNP